MGGDLLYVDSDIDIDIRSKIPPVGAPSIHPSHVFTNYVHVATLHRPEVHTEVETVSHHTYQAAQNFTGPTSSQIKTGHFSIGPAPSVYVSCRLAAHASMFCQLSCQDTHVVDPSRAVVYTAILLCSPAPDRTESHSGGAARKKAQS